MSECFLAKLSRSSFLAIVPSSFIISTITAEGSNPANFAKSIPASVCPALLKTPPSEAFKGNIWPGCTRSEGLAFLFTASRIVLDLSEAEMPVVIPFAESMEVVNAVP